MTLENGRTEAAMPPGTGWPTIMMRRALISGTLVALLVTVTWRPPRDAAAGGVVLAARGEASSFSGSAATLHSHTSDPTDGASRSQAPAPIGLKPRFDGRRVAGRPKAKVEEHWEVISGPPSASSPRNQSTRSDVQLEQEEQLLDETRRTSSGTTGGTFEWPPARATDARCAALSRACDDSCRTARRRACAETALESVPPTAWKPSRKQTKRIQAAIRQGLLVCPSAAPPDEAISLGCGRLIYIDVGANKYETSVEAFPKWYHRGADFFIDAYEVGDWRSTYPEALLAGPQAVDRRIRLHRVAVAERSGFLSILPAGIPDKLDMFQQYSTPAALVKLHDTMRDAPKGAKVTVPAVGLCGVLRSLRRSALDWITLKIDVEGGEWGILAGLESQCGSWWVTAVDELLFECHHDGLSSKFADVPYRKCLDTVLSLRKRGVLAHLWV